MSPLYGITYHAEDRPWADASRGQILRWAQNDGLRGVARVTRMVLRFENGSRQGWDSEILVFRFGSDDISLPISDRSRSARGGIRVGSPGKTVSDLLDQVGRATGEGRRFGSWRVGYTFDERISYRNSVRVIAPQ